MKQLVLIVALAAAFAAPAWADGTTSAGPTTTSAAGDTATGPGAAAAATVIPGQTPAGSQNGVSVLTNGQAGVNYYNPSTAAGANAYAGPASSGIMSSVYGGDTASGADSAAVGNEATATGFDSAAITASTATGSQSRALGLASTADGSTSAATGAASAAFGVGATASGTGSVALGAFSSATGQGSVALGDGSTDGGQAGVVSVGGPQNQRRITNVAPGIAPSDAVNVGQMNQAISGILSQANRHADAVASMAAATSMAPQFGPKGWALTTAAAGVGSGAAFGIGVAHAFAVRNHPAYWQAAAGLGNDGAAMVKIGASIGW